MSTKDLIRELELENIAEDLIKEEKEVWIGEGEKRGKIERNIEIAKSMKNRGKLTIEEIAEYTGLSIEEIEKL